MGKNPVELWEPDVVGFKNWHPGNSIDEINDVGDGKGPPKSPKRTAAGADDISPEPTGKPSEEPIIDSTAIEYTDRPEWGPHPLGPMRAIFKEAGLTFKQEGFGRRGTDVIRVRDRKGNIVLTSDKLTPGERGSNPAKIKQRVEDIYDDLVEAGYKPTITP